MKRPIGADKSQARVLLMGYNGANNTGSEARLLTIIEDVRAVLGHSTLITIPTLNEVNLRRYIRESPTLHIAPIPSIYFFALQKLVKEHDLLLLVEGSCYMDTWTSALLWAFLWVTRCAHAKGKPCLAYAVDAGALSVFNRWCVCHEASKTNLIITRTQSAADRLKFWGVTAPIEVTTDTAFTFHTDPADEDFLQKVWPESASGVVGLAVVNFYLWPVVMRLWGRRERCYKWPYYFSQSPQRRRAAEFLVSGLAAEADRIVEKHNKSIALICMEELDEPLARDVYRRMKHSNRARVFSSREYNASQMTVLLRGLDLLVTSRYHAGVLSLAAQVPQVAVGHDKRLGDFYRELGLKEEFFIRYDSPQMFEFLKDRVDRLLSDAAPIKEALRKGYAGYMTKALRNRELLRDFGAEHGWEIMT
jgi:polysaccharide pyruvyl transferase WcaK-like protein